MLPPKAWLSDSVTSRFLRYQCSVSLAPNAHPTLKAVTHALQCTTEGPYNADLVGVGSVLSHWASTLSSLRLAIELLLVRTRLTKALRKS